MKKSYASVKKVLIVLIAMVLLISTCATVFAANVDENIIAVNFSVEGQKAEGAAFKVYKVAGFADDGTLKPEPPFENYPIMWDIETAEQLNEVCNTLVGYIDKDKIPPTAEGVTDSEGKAEIKVPDKGMYLIVGGIYKLGEAVYSISPAMVKLIEGETHKEVQPKYEKEEKPKEDISVTKIWTSDKDQLFRPTMIEIEIYKDGELYDTVQLSDENGWTYTWPEMDTDSTWTIVEKTVLGEYYVRTEKEEKVFCVYNDFYGEPLDEDFPPPDIPYTGTLWWPVPIMAIGGVLLLFVGILAKRER